MSQLLLIVIWSDKKTITLHSQSFIFNINSNNDNLKNFHYDFLLTIIRIPFTRVFVANIRLNCHAVLSHQVGSSIPNM